jgi:glucosamine--fructose-6-phosphate aminotransferase (isomerizing)
MISAALSNDEARWDELARIPSWVSQALEQDEAIRQSAQRYRYMTQCVVLGRGFNYATAFEWALKLKELTYIVAEPYSSADFQHGPIAVVAGGFPVLAVIPRGRVFPSMYEMLLNLRANHAAELVVISDDEAALSLAQTRIPLPSGIPEWLTPIVTIVLGQLFTLHLTLAKGCDAEQPRGLTKVTETH